MSSRGLRGLAYSGDAHLRLLQPRHRVTSSPRSQLARTATTRRSPLAAAATADVSYQPNDRLPYHLTPGDQPASTLVLYQPGGIDNFIAAAGKQA